MLAHRAPARDVQPVDSMSGSTTWLPCPHARPLACWIAPALAILSLALGCYIFVSTVDMVIQTWSALPFGDQWDMLIDDASRLTPGWFYAQHNEHRLVFPKLIFAIDRFGFAETNKFNLFCNLALPFSLALFIVYAATRYADQTLSEKLWIAGVVFGFLFSAMQWENLVWGFQSVFIGVELATFGAFAAVALGTPTPLRIAAAVVCETVATYTLSSGAIAPFGAITLALWRGWGKVAVAVLAFAAICLLASYLNGYIAPVGHSDPLRSLLQPVDVTGFVLAEIGSPFWPLLVKLQLPARFEQAFGAIGVALFLLAAIGLVRRRERTFGAEGLFLAIAAYVMAVALVTALGRLKFGFPQALASRYTSHTLLFWLSLLLLAVITFGRRHPGWRISAMALTLSALSAIAGAQTNFVAAAEQWATSHLEASTALLADVYDSNALQGVYPPDGAIPFERARSLRAGHLSIFADAWSAWWGTPLAEHVRLTEAARCRGGLDKVSPVAATVHPGWRASGWAWDNDRGAPPSHIVLIDGMGRIVGYALGGFATPQADRPEGSGWHGHFAAKQDSSTTAYALVDDDRTACPLGRAGAS
jgi:hypothetical protein